MKTSVNEPIIKSETSKQMLTKQTIINQLMQKSAKKEWGRYGSDPNRIADPVIMTDIEYSFFAFVAMAKQVAF